MEIRGMKLKGGIYYLGSKGKLWVHASVLMCTKQRKQNTNTCYEQKTTEARALLGDAERIKSTVDFKAMRNDHCMDTETLPYTYTYGLSIKKIEHMTGGFPYKHPRGAIGLVIFR